MREYCLCFQVLGKANKKACAKESKHLHFFSQCSWNSHSYVQINSSDYSHVIPVDLKFLRSYDYIYSPMLFIISLGGNHFRLWKSMLVSQQNSQTSKEIRVDISICSGSSVLYWEIVKQLSVFLTALIFNFRLLDECIIRTWLLIVSFSSIQLWLATRYLQDTYINGKLLASALNHQKLDKFSNNNTVT